MRNQHGAFIVVRADHFDEGIEYAHQNKVPQIQLKKATKDAPRDLQINFKKLEMLSAHLRVISLQDTLENVVNSESIYALVNLETMYASEKQKFTLDISNFANLQHFGGIYGKKLLNIDKAYSLKSTVLRSLPDTDMQRVSELKNLEILHVYSSKIQSLNGIQNLPIKRLSLARNSVLEDIDAIRCLNALELLNVEKCKKIMKHELLEELKGRVELSIIP